MTSPSPARRGGTRRAAPAVARLTAALVAIGAAMACSGQARATATFGGALATREDVARVALDALAARDAATLAGLRISREEFADIVWPRLPASRPEVGMPLDYVWADTSAKSDAALAQLLADHGGRRLRPEAVRFLGASTDYGPFRVHSKAVLTVSDETGARRDVRVFGSLVESDAGWKIFSYIVD